MTLTRRGLLLGVGTAAAAQLGGLLLYRQVTERRRAASPPSRFPYETLLSAPLGLTARLERSGGAELRLEEALGEPLLLHFWATWCEPCRTELPDLLALPRPRSLLVSVDEAWPVVEHFFAGRLPDGVLLDARAEARRAFGVTTLPDSYLLDARGRPLARFHGPRAWRSDAATQTLRQLSEAARK